MKISVHILRILLAGLFAISIVGCERTEDPPPPTPITPTKPPLSHEEKLAGEYKLTRIEYNEDGVIEVLETPEIEGTLTLVHEGSLYMSISEAGDYEDCFRADTWNVTATTLTFDFEDYSGSDTLQGTYTLQGTTLTLIIEEPESDFTITMKWKKKT